MTHTDYTKKLLNIEDENIFFYENCLDIKEIKGKNYKIIEGILTYTPKSCPIYNITNKSTNDIIIQ